MLRYLDAHSKRYSDVIDVKQLAKGGEAIVFRVEHSNLDEVVAKCTINDPTSEKEDLVLTFSSIFYESETLKLLNNVDYIA